MARAVMRPMGSESVSRPLARSHLSCCGVWSGRMVKTPAPGSPALTLLTQAPHPWSALQQRSRRRGQPLSRSSNKFSLKQTCTQKLLLNVCVFTPGKFQQTQTPPSLLFLSTFILPLWGEALHAHQCSDIHTPLQLEGLQVSWTVCFCLEKSLLTPTLLFLRSLFISTLLLLLLLLQSARLWMGKRTKTGLSFYRLTGRI